MIFESWMRDIDKLFYNMFGLAHNDFEDWLWVDAFDDGLTADNAFNNWLEESGYGAV